LNKRMTILLIVGLTSALVLGGALFAQAAQAPAGVDISRVETAVEVGYQLNDGGWKVQGILSGYGYRLEAPTAPSGTGTPCCCVFLPCAIR